MTTTACDDQFSRTTERHIAMYSIESILRRNVADLEIALKQQTERAEAADEKLTTAREDMQSWIDSRNGWMERAGAAEAELAKLRKQKPVAWINLNKWTPSNGPRCVTPEEYEKELELLTKLTAVYAAPVPALAVLAPPTPFIPDDDTRRNDAEFAAQQAATAPSVPDERLKCWLIERPASTEWQAIWLTITTDGRRWVSDGGTMYATGSDWYFTTAASEALKFADKESADEYVRHNKIKDVVVTEHIFEARTLLQSPEVKK